MYVHIYSCTYNRWRISVLNSLCERKSNNISVLQVFSVHSSSFVGKSLEELKNSSKNRGMYIYIPMRVYKRLLVICC